MEINLNSNGFNGIGVGRETFETTGIGVGRETTGVSQASRDVSIRFSPPSSDVRSADIASSEPTADVPDEALSRDDSLGKLVNAAFSLPAPPMPSFTT